MKRFIYLTAAVVLSGASFAQSAITPTEQNGSDLVTDYRIQDLPVKVQEAARAVAGRERYQKIADVDRESVGGFTVWEIEFEREGGNVEVYIDHNGILLTEPGLVDFRVVQPVPNGTVTNAFGAPPGSQVGHSTSVVAHNWENLPAAVQKRAAKFGGKERVVDIDREFFDRHIEFEIEFRRNGWNLEIQFAEDGTIMESNDLEAAPIDVVSAPGVGTTQFLGSAQAGTSAQP